jgi:hypothetical protein
MGDGSGLGDAVKAPVSCTEGPPFAGASDSKPNDPDKRIVKLPSGTFVAPSSGYKSKPAALAPSAQ